MKKILLIIVGVFILGVVGFLIYFNSTFPNVRPAPNIKVDISEANIKRGEYLAHSVAVCMDCHSTRDWTKFSGPLVDGTLGKGGEKFTEDYGLPGNFYSQNITPTRLSNWTDGEIYRAITSGVSKDGRAFFPIMPYPNYAKMTKDDIYSIIAYIRTLKPIENEVPISEASFPMSLIIKTIPQDVKSHPKSVDKNDKYAYGKYVVNAASCGDCHSKAEKGQPIPGMEFAGGMEFKTPMGLITSANITQDKETGIGNWTREQFIARFTAYRNQPLKTVKLGEKNSVMPWAMYATMTDEDLSAIYDYIKTLKSVKNKVITFKKI